MSQGTGASFKSEISPYFIIIIFFGMYQASRTGIDMMLHAHILSH